MDNLPKPPVLPGPDPAAPLKFGPGNCNPSAAMVEAIARVCHDANRAYCLGCGDASQKFWDEAEGWQRESAIKGVQFALDNPDAPASAQHDAWSADKVADGWTFGPEKDATAKTHPCLVPFDRLPHHQQAKDRLFREIVAALSPLRLFDESAVHGSFGLSYASYRVIPRLVMESMPGDWQHRYLRLEREVEERFGGEVLAGRYLVKLRDERGGFVADPLADYRHGRLRPPTGRDGPAA